jgi:cyclophilin family peptidyl-prolyl cis-trans isomerase
MTFIARCLVLMAAAVLLITIPASAQRDKHPIVVISTNLGDIVVELNAEKAPKTVANFLGYVKDGFYSGTIFHRVIQTFMIQGGGFTANMTKKPTKPAIPNEAGNGLSNLRGTIAMARTGDPNSATAQFFINTKDNPGLDHKDDTPAGFGYAVFGKVIDGTGTVEKIAASATGTVGSYQNVPVKPVVIKEVKLR